MHVVKWGLLVHTQATQLYIKPIYLNPQKSHPTKQDKISDQRDEMGEGVCEERRITLIRNQESHLRVDLASMETRTCLVSGTLSVGEQN